MKRILGLLILAAPIYAHAANYATCLLDRLQGLQNYPAANAAMNTCLKEHPGGFNNVEQGAGLGFLSKYDDPDTCTLELAATTSSQAVASQIRRACYRLYKEPEFTFDSHNATPITR